MDRGVSCTFFCKSTHALAAINVLVPAGLAARWGRLRNSCTNLALDWDYSHWAMPDIVEPATDQWLIYRLNGRVAQFLKTMPTRDAAEMWMLHRG